MIRPSPLHSVSFRRYSANYSASHGRAEKALVRCKIFQSSWWAGNRSKACEKKPRLRALETAITRNERTPSSYSIERITITRTTSFSHLCDTVPSNDAHSYLNASQHAPPNTYTHQGKMDAVPCHSAKFWCSYKTVAELHKWSAAQSSLFLFLGTSTSQFSKGQRYTSSLR